MDASVARRGFIVSNVTVLRKSAVLVSRVHLIVLLSSFVGTSRAE